MKNDLAFIDHILDSVNAIEEFSKKLHRDSLISNRMARSAIVREIEIIGEATKNISKDLKKNHPEIEWGKLAGTRDKMIHHYFGVDVDIVWYIIKKDIPVLKKKIKEIKEDMEENSDV